MSTAMRPNVSQIRHQQGLAMVEMVIVLPLLLLLMLATAELGRAFFQYNTLTKAVRDGARYVSANALTNTTGVVGISAQVAQEARNLVVYGNTLGTGTPLLPSLSTGNVTVANLGGINARVSAAYPYTPMLGNQLPLSGWFGGGGISTTFTLRAAVTMRAL